MSRNSGPRVRPDEGTELSVKTSGCLHEEPTGGETARKLSRESTMEGLEGGGVDVVVRETRLQNF